MPRTLSVARVNRSIAAAEAGVVMLLGMMLLRSGPGLGRSVSIRAGRTPDKHPTHAMVVPTRRKAPPPPLTGVRYSASSAKQEQVQAPKGGMEGSVPRTLSVARVSRSIAAAEAGVVMLLGMMLLRSGPGVGPSVSIRAGRTPDKHPTQAVVGRTRGHAPPPLTGVGYSASSAKQPTGM